MAKKTHAQIRESNKKNILKCVMKQQPISRAEISECLHISKPTVSVLVDELIQENWIREIGNGESSSQGGRRPIHLYFNEKAAYVIGTDIGGTKVKIVLSDLNGRIVCSANFSTEKHLETGIMKQIHKEVNEMVNQQQIDPKMVIGMGVGVPGIVDAQSGMVVEAPSLNWVRYPFLAEAERYFSFPVMVDNDVNVAVLGEQWQGRAKQKENVLYIAIGTGIGSGILIHNQLYRGSSNAAGEIGYMITDKQDIKAEFKPVFHRYGYLESVAGGKAIGEKFTKLFCLKQDHLGNVGRNVSPFTGEQTFSLAMKGDALALMVVEEAIEHLAYGIVNAAALLNPEMIILNGGVMKSGDFILPRIQKIVQQHLPTSVDIQPSDLGDHAGVIGAVSLFLREYESILN